MSKKLVSLLTGTALLAALVCAPVFAADDDEKKITIKDVMKKVMKGKPSMLAKVVKSGTDKERKELHEMLVALSKATPKKGEADSWKELTGKIVKASEKFVEGDASAGAALMKASNCKACHSKHK